MTYKVGDLVKVLPIAVGSESDDGVLVFTQSMGKMRGEVLEVTKCCVCYNGYFLGDNYQSAFAEEWLCLANDGVIVTESKQGTYPCLKEYIDESCEVRYVALFTDPHTATIVETSDDKIFPIGRYMQNVNNQNFKLFGGTITLRNNS